MKPLITKGRFDMAASEPASPEGEMPLRHGDIWICCLGERARCPMGPLWAVLEVMSTLVKALLGTVLYWRKHRVQSPAVPLTSPSGLEQVICPQFPQL